jgi:hypothetical protein
MDRITIDLPPTGLYIAPAGASKGAGDHAFTGLVLKESEEDRFLLMMAYSPNKMPLRGADGFVDLAPARVIEKACWRFSQNGAQAGLWHEEGHEQAYKVVENYIYRNDVPWIEGDQTVRKGDWIIGGICAPPTWDLYKTGQIGGGSLQGGAQRAPASEDTLAHYMRSA